MVRLGNLNVDNIEKLLDISLKQEHKDLLNSKRQRALSVPLGKDKWRCSMFPFEIRCGSKDIADTIYSILVQYDLKETISITWENVNNETRS